MKTNIYLLKKTTNPTSRLYSIIVLEKTKLITNTVREQFLCYMYD